MADLRDIDFSKHPKSVSEIKAERSDLASDMTPRDVLISVLRDIDSRAEKPDIMAVVWRGTDKDGNYSHYCVSTKDHHVLVGLLSEAVIKLVRPNL